ncbi:MAG: hypothetical protein M1832_005588 [Thelocarpon impressellum]|nr:MAG: hypothetical protein M1832_005588 [Thelocarpon impressellum]
MRRVLMHGDSLRRPVCLFCAVRFAAVRTPPWDAQRRLLQSSRPAAAGAAEAVQQDDADVGGEVTQLDTGGSSWGNGFNQPFGKPATSTVQTSNLEQRAAPGQSGSRGSPAARVETLICHGCGQRGHKRPECPNRHERKANRSTPTIVRRIASDSIARDQGQQRSRQAPSDISHGLDSGKRPDGGIRILYRKSQSDAPVHDTGDQFTGPKLAFRRSPTQAAPIAPRARVDARNAEERAERPAPAMTSWTPRFSRPAPRPEESRPDSRFRWTSSPTLAPAASWSEPRRGNQDQPLDEVPLSEEDIKEEKRRRREEGFAQQAPAGPPPKVEAPRGRDRDKSRRRQQFARDHEDLEDDISAEKVERKRQKKKDRTGRSGITPTPVLIPDYISVDNLAGLLKVRTEDFAQKLDALGFDDLSYDHVLNAETAGLIAMEYGHAPMLDTSESHDLRARPEAEDKSSLPSRPPVVTIMGHVDHGKTTLLDQLRKSSVAASEHGGITQHIGAFSVAMPSGRLITFLDTPGHAAFLSMRRRGANVTDIVVLVVAADDSVKPQTVEAIKHAKAARVPMIVAVNKIDKEGANVERVKQDLARHGVDVEDFGGDTQVVNVSGKTGQGMAELEEAVATLSEILDLRAERDGQAEGWVLEATTKERGRVATVLVRRGTIRPGDVIVAGQSWARIRTLRNEGGVEVDAAGPGTPVEIDGWREQAQAGNEVLQAADEGQAKSVVESRVQHAERLKMAADMEAVNESRRLEQEKREREDAVANGLTATEAPKASGIREVSFVVKGDVSGSVEAVLNSVSALGNQEVRARVLRSGVGTVSEWDVEHAAAAGGHVISFNTPIDATIARLAESSGVAILDHRIIYRLVDDVKDRLSDQLAPTVTQRVTGEAEVAQVFAINVKGRATKPVAGCKVRNGLISRTSKVRVVRGGEVIYDGSLASLKNVKKDVPEMRKGGECGLGFSEWDGFGVGDQVQCYEERVEKRSL